MAISFPNYKLYIDPVKQVCFGAFPSTDPVTNIVFTDGDKARLELYVVRQTTLSERPVENLPFPTGTVKVQVGNPGSAELISTSTTSALPSPTITANTVGANLSPFTISEDAFSGFFTVTITNSSPSLSATTRFLAYPVNTVDMAAAIVSAVNAQSGWSAASCQVLQTGTFTGTISLVATQGGTVRQLSGVTGNISFASSVTSLSGKSVTLDFSAAAIGTFLGTETSKASTLEVQVTDSGDKQTYIQLPITIRAEVE